MLPVYVARHATGIGGPLSVSTEGGRAAAAGRAGRPAARWPPTATAARSRWGSPPIPPPIARSRSLAAAGRYW